MQSKINQEMQIQMQNEAQGLVNTKNTKKSEREWTNRQTGAIYMWANEKTGEQSGNESGQGEEVKLHVT